MKVIPIRSDKKISNKTKHSTKPSAKLLSEAFKALKDQREHTSK